MAAIFRTVKSGSEGLKLPFGRSKHKKLGEGWGENKEPVRDGVTFYLKYLGSTLLEELTEEGKSYGNGMSSEAVRRVVAMAKSKNKKLQKVALLVCPSGIKMLDLATRQLIIDTTIDRIRFCTADSVYEKVFAFIARNTDNETMECHAYLCAKKKMAQAVTLSVAQAFNLAYEKWGENKAKQWKDDSSGHSHNKKQSFTLVACRTGDSPAAPSPTSMPSISNQNGQHNGVASERLAFSPSPSRGAEVMISSPPPGSGKKSAVPSTASPSTSSQNGTPSNTSTTRKNWVSFDDDMDSSFTSSTFGKTQDPFFFGTDLRKADIDEDVHLFLDGTKSREEFSRQKSVEDLLDL